MNADEQYMSLAIKEAQKAYKHQEVPIGAIIVNKEGKVCAKGYNLREKKSDPTAHAEIVAIRKACKHKHSWRLEDCTIYVTVEPCSMCAGAILWTRMERIVYGADDVKGGALGSSYNLFEQKNLNHSCTITKHVLMEECQQLMKSFFKERRK